MASFDPILDIIRPQIAGECPEITLRWAALLAAREFCQRTGFLRRGIEIDLVQNVSYYQVTPNWFALLPDAQAERDAQEIFEIYAIEVNGDVFDAESPLSFRQRDGNGAAVIYAPDGVEIFPTPDAPASGGLRVVVKLKPKSDAAVLPRELVTLYSDDISFGAIARLKNMIEQPWTDIRGAQTADDQFNTKIALAKVKADMAQKPRGFRVKGYN